MSALSELLTNANIERWSYEAISEKATERGHRLSRDTAWRYMTGRQADTTEPYLRALADVLGLKYDEVRRAAGVPASLGQWTPPAEANALNQREREALDVLIKSMARGKTTADRSNVTPFNRRGADPHQEETDERQAAYRPKVDGQPFPPGPTDDS